MTHNKIEGTHLVLSCLSCCSRRPACLLLFIVQHNIAIVLNNEMAMLAIGMMGIHIDARRGPGRTSRCIIEYQVAVELHFKLEGCYSHASRVRAPDCIFSAKMRRCIQDQVAITLDHQIVRAVIRTQWDTLWQRHANEERVCVCVGKREGWRWLDSYPEAAAG